MRAHPRSHARRALLGLASLLCLAIAPIALAAAGERDAAVPAAPRAETRLTPPAPENEFPVALGSFSTTLIGSLPARSRNIALAASEIDGLVLAPGDVFSFNDAVGARSRERGYEMAPVILHETRQLQAGGGVCQVSSTLFVAALLSGLSTVERHRHSSPVDYIPLGEDATISWGVKDLKLRNDLGQRVRLRVEVVGSTLTARFEGEAAVEELYELVTDESEIPGDPGLGSEPGREIAVFRVRRVGAAEEGRELLHRDVYPPARMATIR
jgi:vancomycin resistance protein YoaR